METEQLLLWIPIYMSVFIEFEIRPETQPCESHRVKAEVAERTHINDVD